MPNKKKNKSKKFKTIQSDNQPKERQQEEKERQQEEKQQQSGGMFGSFGNAIGSTLSGARNIAGGALSYLNPFNYSKKDENDEEKKEEKEEEEDKSVIQKRKQKKKKKNKNEEQTEEKSNEDKKNDMKEIENKEDDNVEDIEENVKKNKEDEKKIEESKNAQESDKKEGNGKEDNKKSLTKKGKESESVANKGQMEEKNNEEDGGMKENEKEELKEEELKQIYDLIKKGNNIVMISEKGSKLLISDLKLVVNKMFNIDKQQFAFYSSAEQFEDLNNVNVVIFGNDIGQTFNFESSDDEEIKRFLKKISENKFENTVNLNNQHIENFEFATKVELKNGFNDVDNYNDILQTIKYMLKNNKKLSINVEDNSETISMKNIENIEKIKMMEDNNDDLKKSKEKLIKSKGITDRNVISSAEENMDLSASNNDITAKLKKYKSNVYDTKEISEQLNIERIFELKSTKELVNDFLNFVNKGTKDQVKKCIEEFSQIVCTNLQSLSVSFKDVKNRDDYLQMLQQEFKNNAKKIANKFPVWSFALANGLKNSHFYKRLNGEFDKDKDFITIGSKQKRSNIVKRFGKGFVNFFTGKPGKHKTIDQVNGVLRKYSEPWAIAWVLSREDGEKISENSMVEELDKICANKKNENFENALNQFLENVGAKIKSNKESGVTLDDVFGDASGSSKIKKRVKSIYKRLNKINENKENYVVPNGNSNIMKELSDEKNKGFFSGFFGLFSRKKK